MRRMTLGIVALALAALACDVMTAPDATPSPSAISPTKPVNASEKRCGDGVCDGPENVDSCPEDCGISTAAPTAADAGPAPPIYVTVAGHIEDVPAYANCDTYPDFRKKLLVFAEMIAPTEIAVNLQVDYEFLLGVSRCETDAMQANTEGQNVIAYLATHYGFEIDPHQEGGWEEGEDNYADVRFLGQRVTPSISENVGGLVWDDAAQFARLAQGEAGRLYPEFTWQPEILTLAVSHDHHLGDFSRDDVASGIWMPKGAGENFWSHDPDGRMVYVGPGEHANWDADRPWQSTPQFVQAVVDQLEQGTVDRDKMYTASIAVPQSVIFNAERHPELLALLGQVRPLVESGQAVYVTYSEAVDIWRSRYDARPNIYFHAGTEPPGK